MASPPLHAPRPDDNPALTARVVRGHNLGLIRDGWLVYYYDLSLKPSAIDAEMLYVLKASDGRYLVRLLRAGKKRGTYDLLTATGPVELDVEIEWAQAVVWIKPWRLTDDEWAQLEVVA